MVIRARRNRPLAIPAAAPRHALAPEVPHVAAVPVGVAAHGIPVNAKPARISIWQSTDGTARVLVPVLLVRRIMPITVCMRTRPVPLQVVVPHLPAEEFT